ncbi:MAG: two-component sensor histidine kinase [Lachnospiraceae bacterium]|nr:two-component sensor histidine kinase [Lachnospiraceae bacterium]
MRQRINLRLSLIALMAVVLTTNGITIIYYKLFQDQVRDDLKQSAKVLVETNIFQDSYSLTNLNLDELNKLQFNDLRVSWIDRDGTVLYDNEKEAKSLPNHKNRPEIKMAIKNGEAESIRHSDTLNMNTFYYAILLDNGTVLRLSIKASNIANVIIKALPVILLIVIIILVVCVVVGHYLTRQLMRPIDVLTENLNDQDAMVYSELEPFVNKIRSQHESILSVAKSKQDFTANVSHELKTPITAISGYAELIENHLLDKESEVHIAEQIRHNADRLYSLVNDIIKLSELDHFDTPNDFERFDLLEMSKDCVNNLSSQAEKRGITVKCLGEATFITADKSLIEEMIDNLLQNAIRYNKDNGNVEISIKSVDNKAIITFSDTGIGISKENLDKVYERFYRVDKSRSRETGGTGLGLAIVKDIVDLHSGEITIKSELGIGTKITVSL